MDPMSKFLFLTKIAYLVSRTYEISKDDTHELPNIAIDTSLHHCFSHGGLSCCELSDAPWAQQDPPGRAHDKGLSVAAHLKAPKKSLEGFCRLSGDLRLIRVEKIKQKPSFSLGKDGFDKAKSIFPWKNHQN